MVFSSQGLGCVNELDKILELDCIALQEAMKQKVWGFSIRGRGVQIGQWNSDNDACNINGNGGRYTCGKDNKIT